MSTGGCSRAVRHRPVVIWGGSRGARPVRRPPVIPARADKGLSVAADSGLTALRPGFVPERRATRSSTQP